MDGDIELDDVKVVNVTGKSYKDKPRANNKESCHCCWIPSLRFRMILIFVFIGIVYIVGATVMVLEMETTLEELDKDALHKSIDRFTMLVYSDIGRLMPYTRHAARQRVTAEAAMNPIRPLTNRFVQRYLNTSIVYHEDGTTERVYRCDSMVNFWGILNTTFSTLWSEFHAGNDEHYCNLTAAKPWEPQPVFPEGFFEGVIGSSSDPDHGWISLFAPGRLPDPMAISIEAIMIPDEDGVVRDKTVYGYLVAAKTMKIHMRTFASNVPSCISLAFSNDDYQFYSQDDIDMWNASRAGTFSEEFTFSGDPTFAQRDKKDIVNCPLRFCPPIPLFHETDVLMTGYFRLCGQDPEKARRKTCINYRLDRPMSRLEEGTMPVIWLCILIVGLMVVLFILFLIFLDYAVLRRVVKLSNLIRQQTFDHHGDINDEDDKNVKADASGKKKKSDDNDNPARGRDEIRNLRLAMEQNNARLRRRVEGVNNVIKSERQRILRHKQAMQLLSLWCERNEFFPGLRPNAQLLRYEPTRNLDDLLYNPLAVEYLKSHCDSECTLENLFFLLDVSWLSELEAAEDQEEDPEKRKQIHSVASTTAESIIALYISEDAPQQINVSSACFDVLRHKNVAYKRGMFDDAVGQVKLMLNTDILPRFRRTTGYTAMSENIYIDSLAYDEDSDLSSESVSTAGSVLSDETGTGPSNMVAFNFKNLYATFDGDTDLGSTCTNELSLVEDPDPITSQTTTTGQSGARAATLSSSNKEHTNRDDEDSSDAGETESKHESGQKENKGESDDESEGSDSSSD